MSRPKPTGLVKVTPSNVNPSTMTLFAGRMAVPNGFVMIDSVVAPPIRVLAYTPACAPHRVTLLLIVKGVLGATFGYMPTATLITAPSDTWVSANSIVLHASPIAQQPGASLPIAPASTEQVPGPEHAGAAHGV